MAFKRKHIFFIVAIVLSISYMRTCINIRSYQAAGNRLTFSSLAAFIQDYAAQKEFMLDFDHILDELRLFVKLQAQSMNHEKEWLEKIMPPEDWFDSDSYVLSADYKSSNQFFPYVQKLELEQDAHIAMWGDLHGSVSTVVNSLLELQRDGFFDEQFKISQKSFYCVFLGDFVDKESHGIELLYLIMKLHNQNPGRVFLLRGNHEDAAVNKTFRKELAKKYSDFDQATIKKIFCLYDHLPVALFAGIADKNGTVNGIQFCHAGLEHGYSARKFLNSDANYELITRLQRLSLLENLPDGQPKEQLKKLRDIVQKACKRADPALEQQLIGEAKMEQRVVNGYNWLLVDLLTWLHKQEIIDALPMLFQDIDMQPSLNLGAIRLGFSWNSFTDQENNRRLGDRDDLHVLWSYAHFNFGPEATDYFLKLNSTDHWKLKMIVRGHQHQGKMLEDLKADKGCTVWFNGKLVTTVASPQLTGYASFIVLHVTRDLSDWSIQCYAAQGEKKFKSERQVRLGQMFY